LSLLTWGEAALSMAQPGKYCEEEKNYRQNTSECLQTSRKKHGSHSLTIDLDIKDEVMQAELFLADGVIVTSQFTGINPDKDDLIKAKSATKLPVLIGSGMTDENIQDYLPLADGFIVGSYFRKDGKFLEKLDPARLHQFLDVFVSTRKSILNSENAA